VPAATPAGAAEAKPAAAAAEIRKEGESDFNQMDQAVLALLVEQYRSLRAVYSSSGDTSNRMIQFLAVASAGFGALAVNSLLRADLAGMWISALLFLVGLPATIAVIYLAWVREFLQKARASLLLLRLEGRISRFVFRLQGIFQETSKVGRGRAYAAMQEVFGDRFLDAEIWMRSENPRGKNLIEKRAYVAVSLVFFVVAVLSMNGGFLIGNSALQSQCLTARQPGAKIQPLQRLAAEAESLGLGGLIVPIGTYRATLVQCRGNNGSRFVQTLGRAYLLVFAFGLGVGAYTVNLLIVVRSLTRQITAEYYDGAKRRPT
jgi:hypothetical protein